MTLREGLSRGAGLSAPSFRGDSAAVSSAPSSAEWCFVYVVLVATALFPGLYDKYRFPPQAFDQVFWSVAYVIAARQLLQMRTQILPLIRRHAALWVLTVLMLLSTLW
jgi:hypothetical protein